MFFSSIAAETAGTPRKCRDRPPHGMLCQLRRTHFPLSTDKQGKLSWSRFGAASFEDLRPRRGSWSQSQTDF